MYIRKKKEKTKKNIRVDPFLWFHLGKYGSQWGQKLEKIGFVFLHSTNVLMVRPVRPGSYLEFAEYNLAAAAATHHTHIAVLSYPMVNGKIQCDFKKPLNPLFGF